MTRWTRNDWKVLGGSAGAIGMQLIGTANAVAHEGHPHRQEAEAAAPTADEQTEPNAEAASDPAAIPPTESVNPPANNLPLEPPESPIDAAASEPLTAPAAVSQASLTEGFSIGLGEFLLGLIIAGPFLLLTLKKQLQS